MISPSHPPRHLPPFWVSSPSPSPSPSPLASPTEAPSSPAAAVAAATFDPVRQSPTLSPGKAPISFSPPLIAMVAVVATAFLIVFYSRPISRHLIRLSRWSRRRRRVHRSASSVDSGSPPATGFFDSPLHDPSSFHHSPYGLDDAVIKTIPLSLYAPPKPSSKHAAAAAMIRECAVCLLEFEENDYVRTLPACSHAFHVDCIDIWLRSHANCPLCRAGIFRPESPFIPLMAARIRPSFDEDPILLRDIIIEETLADLDPGEEEEEAAAAPGCEITEEEPSPRRPSDDRFRDFMLKRSYSFGFERHAASERMMVMEPATASPWRYRRGGGFWSKRPSPFGSISKSRVFSFRYYRGMKSPFFRRRGGFFPVSESSARYSSFGGGGSSRRSKSMVSPMFAVGRPGAAVSSSRLRCGDPEALLSPERFNRR